MSRFNKRAIYQLAQQNSQEPEWQEEGLHPLPTSTTLPDGRLSHKLLSPTSVAKECTSDGITVSRRAHGSGSKVVSRNQIRQRLGDSKLSHLVSAYMEQQIMVDEEIHRTQERLYGVRAV